MADCLVTVSGTTGLVKIDYIDVASTARTLISGPGTFKIADTGSDYTWTSISGDAAVSSLCVTFQEIEKKCYIISWDITTPNLIPNGKFKFDQVEIGSDTYNIEDINYPFISPTILANSINALDTPNVKGTAYKVVKTTNKAEYFLILTVIGEDIPYIRIKNTDASHYIYLKGVYTANCLPTGYTAIDTCPTEILL